MKELLLDKANTSTFTKISNPSNDKYTDGILSEVLSHTSTDECDFRCCK